MTQLNKQRLLPAVFRPPTREESEMRRLYLVRVHPRPSQPRPAKVIQLEARRQARIQTTNVDRLPPRPAA
jgi:hypothetical protein